MQYLWILVPILAVVAIAVFFALRRGRPTPPADPKEQVRELVRTGVMYEEQFIDTYFKVIRDEGFMQNFGSGQEEARQLLTTMIEESKGHKQLLDNVLANLK